VQCHPRNHKRVYRIHYELELNLRIKLRKLLKRDKTDALAVLDAPNMAWSINFMVDHLMAGRAFWLLIGMDVSLSGSNYLLHQSIIQDLNNNSIFSIDRPFITASCSLNLKEFESLGTYTYLPFSFSISFVLDFR
jgi:hypothetical protein